MTDDEADACEAEYQALVAKLHPILLGHSLAAGVGALGYLLSLVLKQMGPADRERVREQFIATLLNLQ